MTEPPKVTLRLTPEQQAQIQQATGQQAPVVRLRLEPLEARLAPIKGMN